VTSRHAENLALCARELARSRLAELTKRSAWVAAYAVAMSLVEAAVVVYLRALVPAEGPLATLQTGLPPRIILVEVVREAATIVMLLAVALLAGHGWWQRFLYFALMFGIWDIFYYVWLRVFIGWPESLLTWDVLFLIPVPWISPVLAPILVSVGLVSGALWLLARQSKDSSTSGLPPYAWIGLVAGAALILLSFTLDSRAVLVEGAPPDFRWGLFATGMAMGVAALMTSRKRGGSAGEVVASDPRSGHPSR
jgi:hypothetical protein